MGIRAHDHQALLKSCIGTANMSRNVATLVGPGHLAGRHGRATPTVSGHHPMLCVVAQQLDTHELPSHWATVPPQLRQSQCVSRRGSVVRVQSMQHSG